MWDPAQLSLSSILSFTVWDYQSSDDCLFREFACFRVAPHVEKNKKSLEACINSYPIHPEMEVQMGGIKFSSDGRTEIPLVIWSLSAQLIALWVAVIQERAFADCDLGTTGLLYGGVAGVLRSAHPVLFAVAAGVQWSALGSTFWG